MPQIVADMATSTGDTLIWDMEAPGGFSFQSHIVVNTKDALKKIQSGGWDYITLQDQSLRPAYPDTNIFLMFKYGNRLDSYINLDNTCAETVFYMSWGRKNGDSFLCSYYTPAPYNWSHYCTYNSMDSVIRRRYELIADSNDASIAPAGAVWRYLRANNPNIELYSPDESHPSAAGSYAVACAFYTAFFRKDPALISFDYNLSSTDAIAIRSAAKKVVYDSMSYWHIGEHKTNSLFNYSITGNTVNFQQQSTNATNHKWYFGDGQTDTSYSPTHTYAQKNVYTVTHVATNNNTGCSDTSYASINLLTAGIKKSVTGTNITITPNPNRGVFVLKGLPKESSIVIHNSIGQLVYQTVTTSATHKISLNDKAEGIYILQIVDKERLYRLNFVVY